DVAEEIAPSCEVPLVRHLHDVLAAGDALDVLPPERVDVILVLRVDGGLPRELPVLVRDGDAVAPLGVLAQVVRDPLRARLKLVVRYKVRLVRELRREDERPTNYRCLEDDVPERVAVPVQDQVQAPARTPALLRPEDQGARALRGGTVRPAHSRRACSRK